MLLENCYFEAVHPFDKAAGNKAERFFEDLLFFLFAVFVGEDAVEVFEEGWAGFGSRRECEGALFDDLESGGVEVGFAAGVEVAELIDGVGGVGAEEELVGEVELGAVAMEGG